MAYPVFTIAPGSVLESEQLGTKDKFWLRGIDIDGKEDSEWLFKFPTEGTGQHWAEKIAYEIAQEMRILTPRVELAELLKERGTVTLNFTKSADFDLYHGNQILHGFDSTYQQAKRFRQKGHTVERIFDSIRTIFRDEKAKEKACRQMASYLVLDALICNVDRHHENWGILRKRTEDGWVGRLAPSYDHASSLGRELQDHGGKQSRERYLRELGVEKYIERGRGPIFLSGRETHGPSPLNLVAACLEIDDLAGYFEPTLIRLQGLEIDPLCAPIDEIPADWMTALAKEFAISLLGETLQRLKRLIP